MCLFIRTVPNEEFPSWPSSDSSALCNGALTYYYSYRVMSVVE